MNPSSTIGRSQRGLDSLRDLLTNNIGTSDQDSDTSDAEDIDTETAINTVYNLLNELGDLNRSNRQTAQALAEQFSVLQAQAIPSKEPEEEDTFHTPPSMSRPAIDSERQRIASLGVQTDLDAVAMDVSSEEARRLGAENEALRRDVGLLVSALKEHQDMAKEYEAALARALVALRSAAFERHLEISEVQSRYRDLLATEQSLNERLQTENIELRATLSTTAQAIRATLNSEPTKQ
ncbi:hypothetical protein GGI20_002639 [Coemansia sp. BCRC 34301]|nr:hypothetical protein GGI20_002639 [Coemansia sp. BCRC 34301]